MPGPMDTAVADAPAWSPEQHARARALLADPGVKPETKAALQQRLASYESASKAPAGGSAPAGVATPEAPRQPLSSQDSAAVMAFREQRRRGTPSGPKPAKPAPTRHWQPFDPSSAEPIVFLEDPGKTPEQNDQAYQQTIADGQRERRTVYRARDMGDDWSSKLMQTGAQVRTDLAATGVGMTRGGSAGIVPSGLGAEREGEIQRRSPIAYMGGNIAGAALGLPARIGRAIPGVSGGTATERLLGAAGGGARAAVAEGAVEEAANAGRDLAAGRPAEPLISPAQRMATRAMLGGAGGLLVQGVGETASAVNREIRRGPIGDDLKLLEKGGGRTSANPFRASVVLDDTRIPNAGPADDAARARDTASYGAGRLADRGRRALTGAPRRPDPVDPRMSPGSRVSKMLDERVDSHDVIDVEEMAARRAVPLAQRAAADTAENVRGSIANEKTAYRASKEGQQRVSSGPLYSRIKDIMNRDLSRDTGAMSGKPTLPFESSSKLESELKRLWRAEVVEATDDRLDDALTETLPLKHAKQLGLELPEGATDDTHVILGRPAEMNAQELDRTIRNLDEIAKAGAKTDTPGTRELGELGRSARKMRDQFGPNKVAPQGYSALRAGHAAKLQDLENKLYGMGLPAHVKDIDSSSAEQVNAVFQAIRQYKQPGNRVRDELLEEIGAVNPELREKLQDMVTLRTYGKMRGTGAGFSANTSGGLHGVVSPGAIVKRAEAVSRKGSGLRGKAPLAGALTAPILVTGPRREEED